MKRTLTIAIALVACLVLSVPAIACHGPNCSQQAEDSGWTSVGNYKEGGNNKAGGWAGYEGYTEREGYASGRYGAFTGGTDGQTARMFGDHGNVGNSVAGAYTGATVRGDSTQVALGDCERDTYTHVDGAAGQGSYVDIEKNNYFAAGGQSSEAGYDASDWGNNFSRATGNASTVGGSAAFGHSTGNHTIAGAITGSMGTANARGDERSTFVNGGGGVEHGTYANTNRGAAGTYGNASYNYSNTGGRNTSGAGMAGTFGNSAVTNNPNGGVTARSSSMSFAVSTGDYGQGN